MEAEAPDQHISKRTKRADTIAPNTESLTESTAEMLENNFRLLVVNPNDPTAWEERRLLVSLVEESMFDWEKELDLVGELAERHSNNYLIWDYRRSILEKLGSEAASKELEFTKKILSKGTKNYQAWSHRQWIIKKFGRSWWLAELQYCHEILKKDSFNTSAWDQICRAVRLNPNMENELRDREAIYAKNAIYAQPGNEGPWTYLKCLYAEDQKRLYTNLDLESVYVDVLAQEADRVQAAVELDPHYNMAYAVVDERGCVHALNLILDLMILGYKANRNRRLVEAVNVLLANCGRSNSGMEPGTIKMNSKIFRKVCAVMFSLDACRIRYCYMYHGHSWFRNLHIDYEERRQDEPPSEIVAMDSTLCDDLPPQSPELLKSMFEDVINWLCNCRHSVFKDFFSLHPDNATRRKRLFERLETYLQKGKGHDLVLVLAEHDTKKDLMWDFRRWVVKNVGTSAVALNELEFTTSIINKDAYNYRAWSHRQWVFQSFGGDWKDEDELAYCAKILEDDSFNSFAWDQRYFVVTRWVPQIYEAKWNMHVDRAQFEKVRKLIECFESKRSKEADYAIEVIGAEPENEYPWGHISGLYTAYAGSLNSNLKVKGAILHVLEDGRDRVRGLKVSDGIMGEGVASSMNARGIINALNMLLDLSDNGFRDLFWEESGKKFRDVIDELCPDSWLYPSEFEFRVLDKVYLILECMEETLTDCGLLWRNAADEVYARGFNGISGGSFVDFDSS